MLWKRTVSAEFRANCLKLCRNCAVPQNFHARKLGEILPFYAVQGGFFFFQKISQGTVFYLLLFKAADNISEQHGPFNFDNFLLIVLSLGYKILTMQSYNIEN